MAESPKPKTRQPAVFVPHGGGPMPLLDEPTHAAMIRFLTRFQRDVVRTKPDAIVLVTAHWEAPVVRITSSHAPPLHYDPNFPPVTYPAPGDPRLAQRIQNLLAIKGIKSVLDAKRGYDHGLFVPLKLMFPDADVPVIQMSVLSSLDPAEHIDLGEALRPLRDDNILIVGSGMSFHNFSSFRGDLRATNSASIAFHDYLKAGLVDSTDPQVRRRCLERWEADAPLARKIHGREEHLLPLHVIAGAGLDEPCEEVFDGYVMRIRTSGYLFGSRT